eukprot:comp23133_c1_seq1/m.37309 comp23133_c1_seq1/g.37309  ORF comp23133_c1_seq1/g.37309 comp23133_c1_seq1/m.37309 type:complete len:265 (-) comp23133_c1_seq1:421-1215(-)
MTSAKGGGEKGRPGSASRGPIVRVTSTTGGSAKQSAKKHQNSAVKGAKEEIYKEKCKILKRRCGELEEQNMVMEKRLKHSKRIVSRLRLERSFLFDKLEQFERTKQSVKSDSSSGSSSDSDDSDSGSDSSESEVQAAPVEAAPKPKASGKGKAEKDPHAPKRPANAFFMFCQQHRSHAQEENTDLRHPEITKILGARWKQMTEQEKMPYYEMYETDKTRYARDLKQYAKGELPSTNTTQQQQSSAARLAADASDLSASSSDEND